MFLPRLARILHHPALATALGAILIVLGAIGLATDEPVGWAILMIVAGVINVLRGVVPKNDAASD